MRTTMALICFTALAGCSLEDTEVSSDESALLDPAAANADSTAWLICQGTNLTGACIGGPQRLDALGWFNDTASSIQTNATAMETWNDADFKGTYGYFAPWGVWDSLSAPYNNAVSSISYPGV